MCFIDAFNNNVSLSISWLREVNVCIAWRRFESFFVSLDRYDDDDDD